METVRVTTSQNIDIEYELAGFGPRFLAYLLDGLLWALVFFFIVASSWLIKFPSSEQWVTGLVFGGLFLLYALYDLICEVFFNGQSIGKRVMKIKVISLDGARPTIGQYILRWLFRIVDMSVTSGLGALVSVAASEKKQRIGDMVAGTTVVRTHPRTDISHVAFMPPSSNYEVVFPEAANLSDKEIEIVHEVLSNFHSSQNYPLIHATANRIKEHLNIRYSLKKDDEEFLETIVKDYNHLQHFEN